MPISPSPTVAPPATEPTSPEIAKLVQEGLGPQLDPADGAQLYLDLLKRTITNVIYQDVPLFYCDPEGSKVAEAFDLHRRALGRDMPSVAHTMVGLRRLENIQACIEQVLVDQVPGDLIETGVARGGSAIFMRGVLKAYGCTDRLVYAADSFPPPVPPLKPRQLFVAKWLIRCLAAIPIRSWQRSLVQRVLRKGGGFPPIENPGEDVMKATMWFIRNLDLAYTLGRATGLANVQANFARYGLLDDQVCFLQGYFADTLPTAPFEQIAVMRLDGDLYESTMDSLVNVYPKLSPGGFCIIDDYHSFPSCAKAVDEYRTTHQISAPLEAVDDDAVYWRKEEGLVQSDK